MRAVLIVLGLLTFAAMDKLLDNLRGGCRKPGNVHGYLPRLEEKLEADQSQRSPDSRGPALPCG